MIVIGLCPNHVARQTANDRSGTKEWRYMMKLPADPSNVQVECLYKHVCVAVGRLQPHPCREWCQAYRDCRPQASL